MRNALLTVVLLFSATICVSGQVQSPGSAIPVKSQPTSPIATAAPLVAQPTPSAAISTDIVSGSKVYITPMDGFENYLAAAFAKKKVKLTLVGDPNLADYVISGTSIDKKAGWAKIVFMGNIHSDNAASITMTDKKSGAILYAYAVDKKSTLHGQQTSAEACAKHLEAHIEGRE